MKYWYVKPIINGFELYFIAVGSEKSLLEYLKNNFKCPISYEEVTYDVVSLFEKINCKVYYLPYVQEETVNTDKKSEQ